MNKKFSTLLAGLALTTAFTANAQEAVLNSVQKDDAKAITAAKDLTKYVHLVSSDKALSVKTNDKGQLEVEAVALAGLDATNVNAALWEVKSGAKDPATGTATYVFVNKATGAALNFDTKANKAKPILAAGSTDWVWSVSSTGSTMKNAAKKVAIVLGTDGAVSVAETSTTAFTANQAATYYLTAAGLNDFYGNGFALSFDKDIEGNPFTATSLKAEGDEITETPANLDDLYVQLSIPGTKKYISVDTTLYTRSGIHQLTGTDGIGYKLTTDTMVYNTTPDKDHVFSTKPAYMYDFRFTLDPSAGDEEGRLTIELKTPVKGTAAGPKFMTGATYTEGVLTDATPVGVYSDKATYLSWTLFENGTKYLSTSNEDAVTLPIITFKAGNYAEIENGAYYWSIANKYTMETATDGDIRWVANEDYGMYRVAVEDDCEAEDATIAGKLTTSKNVYDYLASTQWALNEGTGKGAYTLVNREYPTVQKSVKLYELGNGKYAVGGTQDTIKLTPVEGADKYVGYKHFSDAEIHELVFGLKVASNIADAFVGGVNKEGVLKLVKADELNSETQKFTLEKVGQTNMLAYELADKDSLVYNVYALKQVGGNKYLNVEGNNMVLSAEPTNAYAFKNTVKEGEYKMFIYEAQTQEDSDEPYSLPVYKESGLFVGSDVDLDDLDEDEYEWIRSYIPAKDEDDNYIKAAGSVSDGKFTWVEKCTVKFADRFSIVAEPKAEYATLEAGHKNISTLEDDAKFMTMFSDGLAVLKTADQAMGDTVVTAENLGLWLEEANMEDVVKPLYYITTARGLSEEDQKAGLKYYMVSLKDSMAVEDYTGYDRKVGFVLGAAQGDSALAIVSTKDSLAIETSPAAVAFELTDVEGYYRIVLPGLQETVADGTDKWGDDKFKEQPTDYKYLAVQNNVLYLSSKADAYLFAVNPTEVFPTANEGIEAENGVSVIAGNGTVTVMGAAGQNVTIATVLGKVVANETVASDNATIAAPQGVVFVTVNGETTKVVVK